jgi:predicted nucleic acid-binding protein
VVAARAEAERAGHWRREFAARGVTLSQADCLIAASAVGVDARLITANPTAFPMGELMVEHWPVGE